MIKYDPNTVRAALTVLNGLNFDTSDRVVRTVLMSFVADLCSEGIAPQDVKRSLSSLKPLLAKTIEELGLIRQSFLEQAEETQS